MEFNDLSTERGSGMGVGPIPASKIRERAVELELDEEEADRFFMLIRLMDGEYLALSNKKIKPGNAQAPPVAMDDVQGVKNLFGAVEARQSAKRKKP